VGEKIAAKGGKRENFNIQKNRVGKGPGKIKKGCGKVDRGARHFFKVHKEGRANVGCCYNRATRGYEEWRKLQGVRGRDNP